MTIKSKAIQRTFLLFLSTLLLVALVYQVIYQWGEATAIRVDWQPQTILFLFLIGLLMPVNWGLEAYKLRRYQLGDNFLGALRIVLFGLVVGQFTPGRIGEWLGRTWRSGKNRKTNAVKFGQIVLVTQLTYILFGLCAVFISGSRVVTLNSGKSGFWLWGAGGILLIIGICLIFFKRKRFPWIQKALFRIHHLMIHAPWGHLFGLSGLRYLTFVVQLVLAMKIFGADMEMSGLVVSVMLILFVQYLAPLPGAGAFLVRTQAAILLVDHSGIGTFGIICASSLIWVVNIGLPACIGLIDWSMLKLKTI